MKEYIEQAKRTEPYDMDAIKERLADDGTIRLLHAAIGLSTEAGEFVDMLKKHIFYGKPLDKVNLKEEGGDALWYLAIAFDELSTSFKEESDRNIAKLKARYSEKFTEELAENRNLDKERAILERQPSLPFEDYKGE